MGELSGVVNQRTSTPQALVRAPEKTVDRGQEAKPIAEPAEARPPPDPLSYTPKHLAEKILTSRSALEGERKQVTVLFADVKGSMELAEQGTRWSRSP
jgi:class 3 adenylate cyclase